MVAEIVFVALLAVISVAISLAVVRIVTKFWLALAISVAASALLWIATLILAQIAVTHPLVNWGWSLTMFAVLVPSASFLVVWKLQKTAASYDSQT